MLWFKSFFDSQDDFKKAFALSAALHLLVISFFVIKLLVFSKPLIDLSQAISVNIGELTESDKLPEKAQAPTSTEEKARPPLEVKKPTADKKETVEKVKETKKLPQKEVSDKDIINLSKVKNKQKLALDRIKKMSALDQIKQDISNESKNAAINKARNRVVSAGSALTGLDKIEAVQYIQLLDSRIKESWTLPQWLLNKNLKAQVQVKFNTLGQILSTKLLLSSGNSTYDNYCLQAINNAAPFPKAPNKFSEKFSVDGIIVGFPE